MDFSNLTHNFIKSSPPSVIAPDDEFHHQAAATTPLRLEALSNLNSNSGYATPTYDGGGPSQPPPATSCVKSLKHFKKSMIVEYESSHVGEDSQSSSSSSSTSSSSSSSSGSHLSFKSATSSTLPPSGSKASSNSKPPTAAVDSSSKAKTKRPPEAKKAPPPPSDQPAKKAEAGPAAKQSKASSSSSKQQQQHSKDKSKGGGGGTSKSKQLYCICKSADTQRFMIACDKCDEWYHGDCVGVTQTLSKKIKTFYCHLCRLKSPGLKIRYKRKFQKFLKSMHKNPSKKESLLAKGEIYARFYKETRLREKKEAQLNSQSQSGKNKKRTESGYSSTAVAGDHASPSSASAKPSTAVKREAMETSTTATMAVNTRNTSFDALLSTTESLLNLENSAAVSADLTIKSQQHFGKSNVSGEDIENFFSALTKLGSDVIQMSSAAGGESTTKPLSMQDTQAAGAVKKRPPGDQKSKKVAKRAASDVPDDAAAASLKKARRSSTNTSSSYSSSRSSSSDKKSADASDLDSESESGERDNYETDSYDRTKHHDEDDDDDDDDHDSSSDSSSSDDDDDESDESSSRKKGSKKDDSSKRSKKPGSKSSKAVKPSKKPSSNGQHPPASSGKSAKKASDDSKQQQQKRRYTMVNRRPGAADSAAATTKSRASDQPSKQPAVQCLGPGCVNAAADSSKYCSDQCGLALARERLLAFLEPHLAEYQKLPCYSDAHNQAQLAKINGEIQALRQKLVELEARHVDLDKLIEKAKSAKIDPRVEREQEKLFENNEIEVSCVSCGHTFSERHAFKHMEKCFNKIESQAFFGSYYKTHIDGQSMFCDYYNPQTKMYCKRLKVMCPEHEKEKKIGENEVCGCPLPRSETIIADDTNTATEEAKICLAAKRSCPLHVKWDKVKRAQIDLEKLRTWLKLEELLEKKRFNEISLSQRGSLLSLLLHQTMVHHESVASTVANSPTQLQLNEQTTIA